MRMSVPIVWRNANFVKLWAGQTISLFGSNITLLAIPLAAVTQLNATPLQMGIMQMAQYIPFLLFGLVAGVWVDRLPRRPILVIADIGRAAALAVIPFAAFNGWLRMEVLYAVTFTVGTFNLLFEASYAAILPTIVHADQLAAGNSKLQTSAAVAEIAGPGLAGWVVQLTTATFAIIGDVLSFAVSMVAMLLLRVDERPHIAARTRQPLLRDLRDGLNAVVHNPYIRPLTFCSASANIFINMHLAIYVLYLTRELHFSPTQIGLLYSVGSVGGLVGAWQAERIARWLGLGRAFMAESVAVGAAAIAIPLLSTLGPQSLPLLALVHALWGLWLPVYIVNAASLRQITTPNHMLGRVTASSRFISWGAAAIGFVIGGAVAEQIGLLPTLIVAGVGLLASAAWVIFSPLRGLDTMPHAPETPPVAVGA